MTDNSNDLSQLLQDARDEGLVSGQSLQSLQLVDVGAAIQAGLGVNVADVAASEVVLVAQEIDDSSSIRFGSNAQLMRDGHNLVIDALLGSKQTDGVLLHTRYLNGQVLNPYRPLDQADRMTQQNYNPSGGTPLYDQTVAFLGTVLAKIQEFADNGVPARSISLIASDGADTASRRATAADVRSLVEDLLRQEHTVAAMGVDDGYTDFRRVFGEMGIPNEWILTPNNTQSEIRRAWALFSQSAVRKSQTAGPLGGFGN